MSQTKAGAIKTAAKFAGISVDEFSARLADGLKKCTKCKQWFPRDTFCRDITRSDGLNAVGACCRRVKVRKCTKGRPSAFKGKKHTVESRRKISEAVRASGFKPYWKGKKIPDWMRKKVSEGTRQATPRGKDHYAWSHGRAARALESRRDYRYRWWREEVFKRDNYTCQKCGSNKGGNLRAHHRKPFSTHPELRFDVSNGITLCHPCHELEHFKPDSIRNMRKLKRGERLWK